MQLGQMKGRQQETEPQNQNLIKQTDKSSDPDPADHRQVRLSTTLTCQYRSFIPVKRFVLLLFHSDLESAFAQSTMTEAGDSTEARALGPGIILIIMLITGDT